MEFDIWVGIIYVFLGVVGIIMLLKLRLANSKLITLHRQLANDLLDMLIKDGKNKEEIIKFIEEPETVLYISKPIFYQELNKRFK